MPDPDNDNSGSILEELAREMGLDADPTDVFDEQQPDIDMPNDFNPAGHGRE